MKFLKTIPVLMKAVSHKSALLILKVSIVSYPVTVVSYLSTIFFFNSVLFS